MITRHKSLSFMGLLLLVAGQLLPQIDFSVVNVALDVMGKSLDTNNTGLILIVSIYALCFATFIATGARLGDRYGRKRLFLVGVFGFCLSSAICGIANNIHIMIIGRVFQGIFAALLMPQILSTIHATLNGERHSRAVSIYMSVAGLSVAFGQVLGGWIVSADLFNLGWRIAFYANIPICLIILIVGYFIIPETMADKKPKMDISGIVLFASLMLCLLIPVAMGKHWPELFLLFLAIPPLGYCLKSVELKKEQLNENPLIPPALFSTPSAKFGLLAEIAVTSTYSGFLFVTALCLQKALHFTPFESGNTFMSLGLMFFIGSFLNKSVSDKLGDYVCFSCGAMITALGFITTVILFWTFKQNLHVWQLILTTGLVGLGNAFMLTSAFRITLSNVAKHHASEVSSALITVQQGFFALGTAIMGTVYSSTSQYGYLIAITSAIAVTTAIVLLIGMIVFAHRPQSKTIIA